MDPELRIFLLESGLVSAADEIVCTPLLGGVSCDVWRVDAPGRCLAVKRALPRLRVAALWEAQVSRSEHEWKWLNFARDIVPRSVPRPLAHDPQRGMVAMEFLDPDRFPVWKQLLLGGVIDPGVATSVAGILARIHAASAGNAAIASEFNARKTFFALRIEPYLLEAARRNPAVAARLQDLADTTLATEIALVHGDVSPKNILIGEEGPVFLDAETAWYGDPAFDVAFCLNHLLLKCLARPQWTEYYLACFEKFVSRYLSSVAWENAAALQQRAVHLLLALLLARVDGKSPVEYLTEPDRSFARTVCCRWLAEPQENLGALADRWRTALRLRNPTE